MESFFALLGFGFIVGLMHAFETDHVAAVSTIVSRTRSLTHSSLFGAVWGLGHTAMLFLVALAVLLFNVTVPAQLAFSLEFAVGVMLVVLGIGVLKRVRRSGMHVYPHSHGSVRHVHFHSHAGNSHGHAHRSFLVGLVHGLAGSAALMLLVLATVDSVFLGLLYVLAFGAGSVLGMLLAGFLLGLPFLFASRLPSVGRAVQALSGAASVLVGIAIMIDVSSSV